jgi:DNA polymerase III sliding clamp (beta) subunit (PCNA family)
MPILGNVHLLTRNGQLELTTTDFDVTLTATLPAEGDLDVLLPVKLLNQLVKPEGKGSSEEGVVIMTMAGNIVGVTIDGLTSKLATLPVEEFPSLPSRDGLGLVALWPAAEFRAALSYVLPAVSSDTTRPHLHGVYLDGSRVASTDGHRLHTAALPSSLAEPLFLPHAAALSLERVLPAGEQVVLAKNEEYLVVRCGLWTLSAKIETVDFPAVDQVIPSLGCQSIHLEVEGKVLSKALDRVTKLSSNKAVKVSVNGAVTLSTSDYELGEAETVVPVLANDHSGPDLVTGFCATYIAEALGDRKGTARLSLCGPLDPLRVDLEGGRTAVVMPMRV